jgi:hypothetical protein
LLVNASNFVLSSQFQGHEMSNSKKIKGTCPYCGKDAILTRDHVIPKCLYPNGVPGNSPKVYACSECNNNLKSRLDTYFRDFLIVDIEGSEHPVSKQLFSKFARSIGGNQSEFARHARQAQLMPRFTPEGLFADFVYATQIPNDSIAEGLAMMTRGLYFYYAKQVLPKDIGIQVNRQWDMQKLVPEIQMLFKLGAAYKPAGDGDVFECIYIIVPEKPTASLWLLSFLRKVYFSVAIDLQPNLIQSAS